MEGIVKILGEYFKLKKELVQESNKLDEYARQNHKFFEQEAVLLQLCKQLEPHTSLNSLMIALMQWYYAYVEAKSALNSSYYVDFMETQRRMRSIKIAERELYSTYLSWLN